MSVKSANLLTRLRHPAKSSAPGEKTVLLTGAVCSDMREAADLIERLQAAAKPPVEIRPDDDGGIDEVVATRCSLHIERLAGNEWFLSIEASDGSYWQFHIGSKRSQVEMRHTEMIPPAAISHPKGTEGCR